MKKTRPILTQDAQVLEVLLGDLRVGYLSHYQDGKNIFIFDESYINLANSRPTLSLSFNQLNNEGLTLKKLEQSYISRLDLPPFFSNLLPEGGLREYISSYYKIPSENEFELLLRLRHDLPGNVKLKITDEVPDQLLAERPRIHTRLKNNLTTEALQFSLAGVQIKFSMLKKHEHFTLKTGKQFANYIVKTPSILHSQLPENEYSMMYLAQAVGIDIPEISLVELELLEDLPPLNLPKENKAYVISRYDRTDGQQCIHAEDFAQVLGVYSHRKYNASNHETIARIITALFADSAEDLEQYIKRIVVNILLGNTDAHLKNWSILYSDQRKPTLAPAYDIISSLSYIANRELALNFSRIKYFYDIDKTVLKRFAKRIGLSEIKMLGIVDEVTDLAQKEWPKLLNNLPINKNVLEALVQHWRSLKSPLKLNID